MAENSKIAWTTHTFNPWWGCQRVSPGCQHCYAEALDKRVGGGVDPADGVKKTRWGPKAPRLRTSPANWRQPLRWNRLALEVGERHRVFCASMADVFEDRPELATWRLDLFDLIRKTPQLDWLLLTKRPEGIRRLLSASLALMPPSFAQEPGTTAHMLSMWLTGDPPANVWLGTTVEDQQRADERIPALLSVPAVVRFLSMEPLLEHVELGYSVGFPPVPGPRPDWIIIGGESGHGARPFHTEWARDLVEQARALGAAPFVKQLGENAVAAGRDQLALLKMDDHGDIDQFPAGLRVREFPVVR
ncbi:MAG: phage Gp37/Gp68 family protein [Archangium sp.]|nr:phage Gp37/Gp68 family protein [Archangium sp.]